ncbi:unnamed protein product [Auanema sp. JU1783]|nr:unnamed protein product [Auanema sp. JU1783]
MLFRLIHSSSRITLRNTFRNLKTTSVRLGGHHDHGPTPVYIPQPAGKPQGLFGNKVEPISPPTPYSPGPEDYASFVGAGVGVLLTALAIITYTDVFSKDDKHAHQHKKPTPAKKTEEKVETEAPAAPAPVEEVVEEVKEEQVVAEPAAVEAVEAVEEVKEEASEVKVEETVEKTESAPVEEVAAEPKEIPHYCEYLLIGSGAAAYYAAIAIRARDANAKVLMVGEESKLPYQKPPLSKELWWYGDENSKDSLQYRALTGKRRDVYFEAPGFFVPPAELDEAVHGGVSLLAGHRVVKISPEEKKAYLDNGSVITFNKCLLATGSQPKKLKELEKDESVKSKVLYFRNVDDYRTLEEKCLKAKSVTVVGGGFLGSELAYSLKRKYNSLEVNQIISEKGSLAKILPVHLCKLATESVRNFGINVLTETKIVGAKTENDKVKLQLSTDAPPVESDLVIVAIGADPDVALAGPAGLETDAENGGILADAELRVKSGIYCAGDNCSFYDKILGRRRVEHWEHAQISGRLAGENMTGGEKAFWYQPSFFTKFSPKHHISAVGNTNSSLPTTSVFAKDETDTEKYERGVVFYRGDKNQVVGVLLLNVFGPSIDVARRLIEDGRPIDDFRQLAKLFPLYEIPKDDEQHA